MNELEAALAAKRNKSGELVNRAEADYASMGEQISEAEANIAQNNNIIEQCKKAIEVARENNRQQRDFIALTKRKRKVVARARFDLQQIDEGN